MIHRYADATRGPSAVAGSLAHMAPRSHAHRFRLVRCLLVVPALLLPPLLTSAGPVAAVGPVAGALDQPDPVGVWPLQPEPEVVEGFDPPETPYGVGHRGVDLLGRVGQPVRAALPGTISFTGRIAGIAMVTVDHGATRTTYQPVTPRVAVGDAVTAGATIGQLDAWGSHCFPRTCLHWGWIEGETYLDPLRLVGAGPVRLLPLWRAEPLPARALTLRSSARGTSSRGTAPFAASLLPYRAWRSLLRLTGPFDVRWRGSLDHYQRVR